jgi:thioredoxin-dependent peroxiredoxin
MRLKFAALFLVFHLWLSGGMIMAQDLKPGDEAPNFALMGSDGKIHRLSDYKNKQVVILAWFPKAFTGGCTAECKSFRENGKPFQDARIAYFTASCDSPETNKKFAESLSVDYPILSDPEKTTAKLYGVVSLIRLFPARWTFYIGKDGKIVYIDKQINTETAAEDVVKKLKELKLL